MHLILDVHSSNFEECNTEVTFVRGGCTSLVQPIDAVFNKPFESAVDHLATAHMQENVYAYDTG